MVVAVVIELLEVVMVVMVEVAVVVMVVVLTIHHLLVILIQAVVAVVMGLELQMVKQVVRASLSLRFQILAAPPFQLVLHKPHQRLVALLFLP